MRSITHNMIGLVLYAAPCHLACAQWDPALRWGLSFKTPEEAVRMAESGFVGRLEWYDIGPSDASGRIVPTHAIWGDLPGPIEIGRRRYLDVSVYEGRGSVREGGSLPLLCMSRGQGGAVETLFIALSYRWKDGIPLTDDMMLIHDFELAPDTFQLRRGLVNAVADPESSELLWSYALRRLYRSEKDSLERCLLLLDPRIQRSPPPTDSLPGFHGGRLGYATALLTGQVPKGLPGYAPPSADDLAAAYMVLVEVFEEAPTPYMARIALERFCDEPTRHTNLPAATWFESSSRIRAALQNPDHAVHKTTGETRKAVNDTLEFLFGEADLLGPDQPNSRRPG